MQAELEEVTGMISAGRSVRIGQLPRNNGGQHDGRVNVLEQMHGAGSDAVAQWLAVDPASDFASRGPSSLGSHASHQRKSC